MPRFQLVAALALFAAFTVACSGGDSEETSSTKGEESPVPDPTPKADTWFAPTFHGELAFGATNEAAVTDGELFHAWDFTLSDTARAHPLHFRGAESRHGDVPVSARERGRLLGLLHQAQR